MKQIVHIVYPTRKHYDAAVGVDAMRWIGLAAGKISPAELEAIGLCIVKLTNREAPAAQRLATLMTIMTMIAVSEGIEVEESRGADTGKQGDLDLGNAFGMEDFVL